MPLLRFNVDAETYVRLVEEADAQRRPVVWQAEVVLRRALGLPIPPDEAPNRADVSPAEGADR